MIRTSIEFVFLYSMKFIVKFRVCLMFSLYMMIIAYIRDDSENDETLKIERVIETRTEPNGIVSSAFIKDSHSNQPDAAIHNPKTNVPKKMLFDEIVKCFSIRKNMRFLITVDKPPNAVPIIDGIKYVSIFFCHAIRDKKDKLQ